MQKGQKRSGIMAIRMEELNMPHRLDNHEQRISALEDNYIEETKKKVKPIQVYSPCRY